MRERSRMSLDGGRSAASIGVTDRGKCVLKRERVKVDEGLGKSEEIGPLLAIRSAPSGWDDLDTVTSALPCVHGTHADVRR
jgi:hypothetical protein